MGAPELARPRDRRRSPTTPAARRRVPASAARVDGLLLALSTAAARRASAPLPLLVEDADWDAVAERLHELVAVARRPRRAAAPTTLREALIQASGTDRAEVAALAGSVLAVGCAPAGTPSYAAIAVALLTERLTAASRRRER